MYCKFYGLKEKPFNVTADPLFFFSSKKHKEAFSHLLYGVSQKKGIIVLTGEIGTGKTTLCRYFLEHLGENVKTAFILNPFFSDIQLLEAITRDFGLTVKGRSRFSFVNEFNKFLLNEAESGNNVALIIDEAQNLTPRQLEQVRLLSNLETQKDKLLQIVLVGQPELNDRLNLHSLRQLRQRVIVKYHIAPLEVDEMISYINHRLEIAGANGNIKFSQEAYQLVYNYSQGTPRLINILCDRTLLAGYVSETNIISEAVIQQCMEELKTGLSEANA